MPERCWAQLISRNASEPLRETLVLLSAAATLSQEWVQEREDPPRLTQNFHRFSNTLRGGGVGGGRSWVLILSGRGRLLWVYFWG